MAKAITVHVEPAVQDSDPALNAADQVNPALLLGAATTSATVSPNSSSQASAGISATSPDGPVAGDPAIPPPLDAGGLTLMTASLLPDTVFAVVTGGLTINLEFDAAAMAAPASFRAGIQQAANLLAAAISDPITVNIKIDYGGTGGWAAAGPDAGLYEDYSTIRTDLINDASAGDTIFNSLPTGSSIQGQSLVAVWNAQLKALGLLSATAATDDGAAYFSTDINPNLLVGVALHELTHTMGRVPYGPQPDIFDFYRFTGPSQLLFQSGATAPSAYFSLDQGYSALADYGQTSDASDFLNSGPQGPNDPFTEFYSGSTSQQLSGIDLIQLDALGFHLSSSAVSLLESAGSTSLVRVGTNYFMYPTGTTVGPVLRFGGVPMTVGQFGSWAPIAAEALPGGGYEVAWKVAGADEYSVWTTDANGDMLANPTGVVSGSSYALESLEPSFRQDLNGDGTIGVTSRVIATSPMTAINQVANAYSVTPVGSSSGPVMRLNGSVVTVGDFGAWVPFAAAPLSRGGYEVAWRIVSADQYSVWDTDSSGNMIANPTGVVSGSSYALESMEPSFQQDLNGDGTIGPTVTVLADNGTTRLSQVADAYSVSASDGTSSAFLKFNGTLISTGRFGTWAPFAAAPLAGGGYEVAWRIVGADKYSVWNTDGSGNMIANPTGVVSGSSAALQSLEPSFHQDLNGDGTIGVVPASTSAGAVLVMASAMASALPPASLATSPTSVSTLTTPAEMLSKPSS